MPDEVRLMWHWGQPYWLMLLLVLAVVALWQRRQRAVTQAPPTVTLIHPDLALLPPVYDPPATRLYSAFGMNLLALTCLVLALAQPQWLGNWLPPTPLGREIVLLVDTSKSMSISDFELNGQAVERLAVLKDLVTRFVAGRAGDRFGLIGFGSVAGTLVPPTFDRGLLIATLARLQVGMAGDDTALGDAIGLALKQLHGQARLRPALILFTDGDSTAGDIKPAEAVVLAQRMGVPIYTVQVGGDLFAAGRAPQAVADSEPGLQQIAAQTGGRAYQAGNRAALQNVIHDIGLREATVTQPTTRRATEEWYWLPLLLGALLMSVAQIQSLQRAAA
jgi:Ca-activated chloride channel family protein